MLIIYILVIFIDKSALLEWHVYCRSLVENICISTTQMMELDFLGGVCMHYNIDHGINISLDPRFLC